MGKVRQHARIERIPETRIPGDRRNSANRDSRSSNFSSDLRRKKQLLRRAFNNNGLIQRIVREQKKNYDVDNYRRSFGSLYKPWARRNLILDIAIDR